MVVRSVAAGQDAGQLLEGLRAAGPLLATDVGMMPLVEKEELGQLRRHADAPLAGRGQDLVPGHPGQPPAELEDLDAGCALELDALRGVGLRGRQGHGLASQHERGGAGGDHVPARPLLPVALGDGTEGAELVVRVAGQVTLVGLLAHVVLAPIAIMELAGEGLDGQAG
jgi:hypothetical protein